MTIYEAGCDLLFLVILRPQWLLLDIVVLRRHRVHGGGLCHPALTQSTFAMNQAEMQELPPN
ncbi:MAG: hypothetical protein MI923_17625 [Phycisphaerales bacterium]|nr:hypothetical protein [Phycisphaerales bacterium]